MLSIKGRNLPLGNGGQRVLLRTDDRSRDCLCEAERLINCRYEKAFARAACERVRADGERTEDIDDDHHPACFARALDARGVNDFHAPMLRPGARSHDIQRVVAW